MNSIRWLGIFLGIVLVLTLIASWIDYNGYCPNLYIGTGAEMVPCSFWSFYLNIDHLPLIALALLIAVVLLILSVIWMLRLIRGHVSGASEGEIRDAL
jgi:hypothetical protein